MALASLARAAFGYLFLVLVVRTVGRRPGKQLTPFEFVLIFYLGGLMLTAVVRDEASLTSAFCQILAIALTHYAIVFARSRSSRLAQLVDGTPLTLLEGGFWRAATMKRMRVADDDVMEMARGQGLRSLEQIDMAVLERNGQITILPKPDAK